MKRQVYVTRLCEDPQRIDATAWAQRPFYKVMPERLARLVSPLL